MPLNPPDRLQLLDKVLEILEREPATPAGDGSAYETRIALSLLRLIRRELATSEQLLEEERLRLVKLLDEAGDVAALNHMLCERIRSGRLDIGGPALLRHLRLTTLAKLAIDNPRYSACRRALAQTPASSRQ